MQYTKISPLGHRLGPGTFDAFFDTEKYVDLNEAEKANDVVIVDFVVGDDDLVYFQFHNSKNPAEKKYHRLNYQHFPCGVDALDDNAAVEIAVSMF